MESFITNETVKLRMDSQIPQQLNSSWIAENIVTTAFTLVAVSLVYGFLSIKRYRESVISRSGTLKKIPGNKWLGTIPAMVDIYKESPQETHPQGTMTLLQRKHKLDNIWFMDSWPATGEPHMIIADPAVAAQISQMSSLPKHSEVKRFVNHMTGPLSLIFNEGELWRKARSVFNPGFALSHLMTLVPGIVDDTIVYQQVLNKYAASGQVFQLEDSAAKLAFDIMGHVVLDHDLNSQVGPNELVDCFRAVVDWSPSADSVNPFINYNPFAFFVYKYYARRMNRYVAHILDERFERKSGKMVPEKKGRKPAIDLALDEYARQEAEEGRKPTHGIDPAFKRMAIDQMKSFLFAGHDTSSSTICFAYHMLSRYPEAAAKLRKEYDEVFGTKIARVGDILKKNPNLINKVPYTTAVIKETLRLFPPASTVRAGNPDVNITYNGQSYPTDGCLVWIVSHAIHRRPDLFPNPDAFIPERFLPSDHPDRFQEIPKDAWRPFEKGPRNCIGQELAMLEIKIALVMTCREFEVKEAYEYWDRKLGREKPGEQLGGLRGMFGDRAYQVLQASAKPKDGFPATVKRRSLPPSQAN